MCCERPERPQSNAAGPLLEQLHNTIVAAPDKIREQCRNETRMHLLHKTQRIPPKQETLPKSEMSQPRLRSGSLAERVLEL